MSIHTFPRILTSRGWDINIRFLRDDIKITFPGKQFRIDCNADIINIEFPVDLTVAEIPILNATVQNIDHLANAKETAIERFTNAIDDVVRDEGSVNRFVPEKNAINAAPTLNDVDIELAAALNALP